MINFEDFKKIDLRVAKILKAEKVEGTDKLLKIEVDVGEEKRQIVSGIAESYLPEEIVGKNIVIAYNLEPKKIFGLESQGMLLAADEEELSLLIPDKDIRPGTKIS
jgi:methionine--tRNA ligase beta chain